MSLVHTDLPVPENPRRMGLAREEARERPRGGRHPTPDELAEHLGLRRGRRPKRSLEPIRELGAGRAWGRRARISSLSLRGENGEDPSALRLPRFAGARPILERAF